MHPHDRGAGAIGVVSRGRSRSACIEFEGPDRVPLSGLRAPIPFKILLAHMEDIQAGTERVRAASL